MASVCDAHDGSHPLPVIAGGDYRGQRFHSPGVVSDSKASNPFRQVRDPLVPRRDGGRYHSLNSQGAGKYVRRGNRFVTFHLEATNQEGEEVTQYDYTCAFDYA